MQPGKNVMSIRLGGGVGFNRYMYITQFNGNVNSARGLRVFVALGGMPTHVAGYGKMKMGHVGSQHCTLDHMLGFFFCVTTMIGEVGKIAKLTFGINIFYWYN